MPFKETVTMPIAREDMDFIKAQFEAWLTEMLPEQKPGVYDLELRTRMRKVEEELRHQRELMQQGFAMMEKRFELVDKRFELVDKRFEQVDKRFEQVDKRFESNKLRASEKYLPLQSAPGRLAPGKTLFNKTAIPFLCSRPFC
jgi:hypothetical protein